MYKMITVIQDSNMPSVQRRVKYLRCWLSCGWWLCHLDVLHLDGVLGVRLGVMKLSNIHCGVLRLVRWGSLERKSKQRYRFQVLCRSSQELSSLCFQLFLNKSPSTAAPRKRRLPMRGSKSIQSLPAGYTPGPLEQPAVECAEAAASQLWTETQGCTGFAGSPPGEFGSPLWGSGTALSLLVSASLLSEQ